MPSQIVSGVPYSSSYTLGNRYSLIYNNMVRFLVSYMQSYSNGTLYVSYIHSCGNGTLNVSYLYSETLVIHHIIANLYSKQVA